MAHPKKLDEAYEEAIAACERYFKLAGVNVDIDEKNGAVEINGKTSEGVDNTFDLLWRLISEQKGYNMEDKSKLSMLERRLHKLKTNGRNEDSPGVIRKIEREIRNIKQRIGEE